MRTLVALLVLVAIAAPIHADHCWTWSSSPYEVYVGGIYFETDMCQVDGQCAWSVWIYQESNGLDGLQRKDALTDDTCHGMFEPDTLIF